MASPDAPADGACVFCAIVAHESPAYVVYEDRTTMAFLDLFPFELSLVRQGYLSPEDGWDRVTWWLFERA